MPALLHQGPRLRDHERRQTLGITRLAEEHGRVIRLAALGEEMRRASQEIDLPVGDSVARARAWRNSRKSGWYSYTVSSWTRLPVK